MYLQKQVCTERSRKAQGNKWFTLEVCNVREEFVVLSC